MTKAKFDAAILTAEQKRCVEFDSGDLLIKGVAGSGKSYVLLRRALSLNKKKGRGEKIAVFTYANTLVKYTDELVKSAIGTDDVLISTVDSYCVKLYNRMFGRLFKAGNKSTYQVLVNESLTEHKKRTGIKHRLYDVERVFFEEEFQWIREKCIKTIDDYLSTDRKGRGSHIRLSVKDRKLVWSIFELYSDKAKKIGFTDWPDLYLAIVDNLNRIPEPMKIDHILVDEAQDLTVGKLRVMKALAKRSLTIAADIAQKIYKTSFTWKEVGVDIKGKSSKSLTKSFRSTKQIVELAEDLMALNRRDSKDADEYTNAVLPEAEGNVPTVVMCKTLSAENEFLLSLLKAYDKKQEVIGVIGRTKNAVTSIANMLKRNGLSFEIIDKNNDWSLLRPGIKLVVGHSSKGLEFERVIIPNFNDSEYPLKLYRVDDDQIEEHLKTERSLLYVEMTRARSSLTMLCIAAAASRFIDDFDLDHYEMVRV